MRAAIDEQPAAMRETLLVLRELVHQVAASDPEIGELEETLKWGEPAFVTPSRSGTTVRISAHKKSETTAGLYVNCQTDLVERYRELYDGELKFQGSRAILLEVNEPLPTEPLRHCIAMALTYHVRN